MPISNVAYVVDIIIDVIVGILTAMLLLFIAWLVYVNLRKTDK